MKSFRPLWLLCFFLATIISCTKQDSIISNDPPDNNSALNETLMLQLVNEQRQQGCNCGSVYYPPVPPLTWNNLLEDAALAHATDMYENNYFSHTGRDGSNAGDRINRTGYFWRAYGENIAKGYKTEQAVMDAWILSEGHCKNIMSPNFRELGAAKVNNYWVQEFGSR